MAGTGKSRRGFASMDPSRQREIASKGGRAAHEKGTAHEWSSDEARVAGQKGGIAVSRDRAHMAAIGREGGESRSRASRQARETGAGINGANNLGNVGTGIGADREMMRTITRENTSGERGQFGGGTERDVRTGPTQPADGR
jgi:uncharacterized protein